MCAAVAQVALHYDYAERTAWLEPLGSEMAAGAWGLCDSHAGGLRVPSGWKLVDHTTRPGPSILPYRPPLAV
jgi:hypothetical protein